jgi:hypothetical protein
MSKATESVKSGQDQSLKSAQALRDYLQLSEEETRSVHAF